MEDFILQGLYYAALLAQRDRRNRARTDTRPWNLAVRGLREELNSRGIYT